MQKVTYLIEVKPVLPYLESLNSEVIYVLLCAVFLNVNSISVVPGRSAEYSNLHLIYRQCEMIYGFALLTCKPHTYVSSASGLYKFIIRQMLIQGSLA